MICFIIFNCIYINLIVLVESKMEEHKKLMEKKDLKILELTKQLKAQEKEKQNEIIKLQIEVCHSWQSENIPE